MLGLSAHSLWESFYHPNTSKPADEQVEIAEPETPKEEPTTPKRTASVRHNRWKYPLDEIRPDGVKVELKGDDLLISGQAKDNEKPCTITRRVTLPRGVSKKTVKCYVDPNGKLSIEASYSFSKPLARSKTFSAHSKPSRRYSESDKGVSKEE